jgi:RES domain-containing protein
LPPLTLAELPQLWLSTLRLPDQADNIFWLDPAKLPPYWKRGTLSETQMILTDWLQTPFCLAIAVPSVILEMSYNLLLHPQHASFAEVEVVSQSSLALDSRLRT